MIVRLDAVVLLTVVVIAAFIETVLVAVAVVFDKTMYNHAVF